MKAAGETTLAPGTAHSPWIGSIGPGPVTFLLGSNLPVEVWLWAGLFHVEHDGGQRPAHDVALPATECLAWTYPRGESNFLVRGWSRARCVPCGTPRHRGTHLGVQRLLSGA